VVIAAPAALAAPPPSLALVRATPGLTVRGNGFKPLERVRVTAPRASAVVRASQSGGFTVVLTGAAMSRCSGLVVHAVGASGTTALLKIPRPACLPVKSPSKTP
jgi:hypothetical protein